MLDVPLLLIVIGGAIFSIVGQGYRAQRCVGWVVLAMALLVSLDQLRLQPWVYHALLIGLLLSACREELALRLARLLSISVYAYAGIAKLDHAFATTLGQQFLVAAMGMAGIDPNALPQQTRFALALGLPLVELLVAGLLLAGLRNRWAARVGCLIAVVMHGGAMLLLSPLGLGHSLGVIVWNVCFAIQTCVLFWSYPKPDKREEPERPNRWPDRLAAAVVLFAIVAPLSAPWGAWDRWPSWGLYAPGGERATTLVHRSVWERLPQSLRDQSTKATDPSSEWRPIAIDHWVLSQSRAPIYPQNRVEITIAASLAEEFPLGDRVRVLVEGRADRFTGERRGSVLEGSRALRAASDWWGVRQPVDWP